MKTRKLFMQFMHRIVAVRNEEQTHTDDKLSMAGAMFRSVELNEGFTGHIIIRVH